MKVVSIKTIIKNIQGEDKLFFSRMKTNNWKINKETILYRYNRMRLEHNLPTNKFGKIVHLTKEDNIIYKDGKLSEGKKEKQLMLLDINCFNETIVNKITTKNVSIIRGVNTVNDRNNKTIRRYPLFLSLEKDGHISFHLGKDRKHNSVVLKVFIKNGQVKLHHKSINEPNDEPVIRRVTGSDDLQRNILVSSTKKSSFELQSKLERDTFKGQNIFLFTNGKDSVIKNITYKNAKDKIFLYNLDEREVNLFNKHHNNVNVITNL